MVTNTERKLSELPSLPAPNYQRVATYIKAIIAGADLAPHFCMPLEEAMAWRVAVTIHPQTLASRLDDFNEMGARVLPLFERKDAVDMLNQTTELATALHANGVLGLTVPEQE